jgi:hypothetical protein
MSDDEIPNPADIYGFISEDKKTEEDFLKLLKNGLRIIHN